MRLGKLPILEKYMGGSAKDTMKTHSVYRIIVSSLIVLSASKSVCQTTPPQYNPNNWSITATTIGSGDQKIRGWDAAQSRAVETGSTINQPQFSGVIQGLPYASSMSLTMKGATEFKIRWVGSGPAPTTVIVRLSALCEYTAPVEGGPYQSAISVSASTGLPNEVVETDQDGERKEGWTYRELPVSNGEAKTKVSGSANGTISHVPTSFGNFASASAYWSSGCTVASRALALVPTPGDTYYKGITENYTVARMLHSTENLDNREMTVGVKAVKDASTGIISGLSSIGGSAIRVGQWTDPTLYTWSSEMFLYGVGTPAVTASNVFSEAQLKNMAGGSPIVKNLSLYAQDSSNLPSRSATLKVNFRSEVEKAASWEEFKTGGEDDLLVNGSAIRAQLMTIGEVRQVAVTSSVGVTHLPPTWVLKLGGAWTVIKEILTITVGAEVTLPSGPIEECKSLVQQNYTLGPCTAPGEVWTIKVKTSWYEKHTKLDQYGDQGYLGQTEAAVVKQGSIAPLIRLANLGVVQ